MTQNRPLRSVQSGGMQRAHDGTLYPVAKRCHGPEQSPPPRTQAPATTGPRSGSVRLCLWTVCVGGVTHHVAVLCPASLTQRRVAKGPPRRGRCRRCFTRWRGGLTSHRVDTPRWSVRPFPDGRSDRWHLSAAVASAGANIYVQEFQ